MGQQWVQERAGSQQCCPAAQAVARHTEQVPGAPHYASRAERTEISSRTPTAGVGPPQPFSRCFTTAANLSTKGQNPQITLFYAQLAAEELLSVFSAFISPPCLLVPDD